VTTAEQTAPTLQIAFLTGSSNPKSCALSPDQEAFLARLSGPSRHICDRNFPYHASSPAFRHTPLLKASLSNTVQFLASRRRGFSERYQPTVQALLDEADHTVFLAGSCGLELLANLTLRPEQLSGVSVFAYGPVARHRPACTIMTVQGTRDMLSRTLFGPADAIVATGHMDYLRSDAVLSLCQVFLARVEASIAPALQPASTPA
jgi:hypothetical protein